MKDKENISVLLNKTNTLSLTDRYAVAIGLLSSLRAKIKEPIPVNIKNEEQNNTIREMSQPTPLKTEDTGKMFEKAICDRYGIPYDGHYKYDNERPQKLQSRLSKLPELFPNCTHTAKKRARYDFTAVNDPSHHLSAKTTKDGVGKVAPSVIGQSQPEKFCDLIGIPFTTIQDLKQYIQINIHTILPILADYTFDCPTIYYNEKKDTIRYITLSTPIEWTSREFTWTCNWENWTNSSTLKIKYGDTFIALLEVQFHTKNRTNMAVRWCYDNLLTVFQNNLSIVSM